MARYAAETDVTVERSQGEIRAILKRYGATGFAYAEDDTADAAMIVFRLGERHYRIYVPLPDRDDPAVRYTPGRRLERGPAERQRAYDALTRQRWRAVALYIKATLEAVESGIISAERALLAHMLLANGRTVGQETTAPIEESYRTGRMPELLPGLSAGRALPAGGDRS